MNKSFTLLFLLFVFLPVGTIKLYSQSYMNVNFTTNPNYKYALLNDVSKIIFNPGGTNMTVELTDASSSIEDLSSIVKITFDDNILGGGEPFPVELISFTAEQYKDKITLLWTTATELNNYGFEIERYTLSANSKVWKKIGFVQGNGNSNSPKRYSFMDEKVPADKISYRLKQIDFDGSYEYSNIVNVNSEKPESFSVDQNYPNPFNPETKIYYSLPKASTVTIKVYNVMGQEVATLINERQEAGKYSVVFNGANLSSGAYFYSVTAEENVSIKKMILLR